MTSGTGGARTPLTLQFPASLAVYDDYAAAQKAVDHLADEHFPVGECMIVGTDLKRVERITAEIDEALKDMGFVKPVGDAGLQCEVL